MESNQNQGQDYLRSLTLKRASIRRILTNIRTQLARSPSIHQLIERAKSCYDSFLETQTQIDTINDNNEEHEWDSFLDSYNELVNDLEQVKLDNAPQQSNSFRSNSSTVESAIRLPPINLPTYAGNYEEWLTYHDTFESIVHSNEELQPVQKFHYLKSTLRGEAFNVIQGIEVTSQNYETAWNTLKERYHNVRAIVKKHLKSLVEMPACDRNIGANLREIHDHIIKHTRALKSLGEPVDYWDSLLIYLISIKLDNKTILDWELSLSSKDRPTLKQLLDFIQRRSIGLEITCKPSSTTKSPKLNRKLTHFVTANMHKCFVCAEDHMISQCKQFLKGNIEERRMIAKEKNLCYNCLKTGHRIGECRGGKCRTCHKKHHTLLHIEQTKPTETIEASNENVTIANSCTINTNTSYVLLATAEIHVQDKYGNTHKCTALLDSGSQSSLITRSFVRKFELHRNKIACSLRGITGNIENINESVTVEVKSIMNQFAMNTRCLVVNKISERIPIVTINEAIIDIPNGIHLADPNFCKSKEIDVLLGSNVFWKILRTGRIETGNFVFAETEFGWIASGEMSSVPKHVMCNYSRAEFDLTKFWRIEECNTTEHTLTSKERKIEKQFEETVQRNGEGRFIVELPIKGEQINLGESKTMAVKRYMNLEKKLSQDQQLYKEYKMFMKEYLALGHMEKVVDSNRINEKPHFYLPHHAVVKADSLTTKLRVVFDGSAKSSNGRSLNDNLEVGPVLQDDLFTILIRFRTKRYVLTADVTKMYRQVLVKNEQRKLQRILWRDDKTKDIDIYELKTLTYGTASASYLAIRCLRQLAMQNIGTSELGAKTILSSFYVDDLLCGASTENEATQIIDEVTNILKQGKFELRKWCSNEPALLRGIPQDSSLSVIAFEKGSDLKTLELNWNFKRDLLCYSTPTIEDNCSLTKRRILSELSRTFDPLGPIGPFIIKGKVLLQQLWKLNLEWDDEVPSAVREKWQDFQDDMKHLNKIRIPRLATVINNDTHAELIGFCDASSIAYGACIYLREKTFKNNYNVRLLCAKSRVAPVKTVSIPRLELCGAVLLANLVQQCLKSFTNKPSHIFYYTDSKVVLSWLAAHDKRWKVFVANRIGDIQAKSDISQWKHVRSKDNPADIISRGIKIKDLIECSIWWEGPNWLKSDNKNETDESISDMDKQEIDKETVETSLHILQENDNDFIMRFSSYRRLLRVTALCLRYITSLKNKRKKEANKFQNHLTVEELADVKMRLIRNVQNIEFSAEIKALEKGNNLSKQSKLLALKPFIDSKGILRVGGRLQNSDLDYNAKHQVILPKDHHFTTLLVRQCHEDNLHIGVKGTISLIREEFWPLNIQSECKRLIRKCIRCFKFRPSSMTYVMGDLPANRVTITRPFSKCGIDFCGPFKIKLSKRRNSPVMKVYIAIYICLAVKAIHLEIVEDLTMEAFLASFKRFVARRGKPSDTFSDNGTNFVAANKELRIWQEQFRQQDAVLANYSNDQGVKWHFSPPRAPHFGGLWEAAVKSLKTHMKKTIANALLRYDEFMTLVAQIEAVLNSRPLTPLSEDINDLEPLTPFHFLIGKRFSTINEPSLTTIRLNNLSRWQYIERLRQGFWTRWSKEYLHQLQQRNKWTTSPGTSLKGGQLVIVKEDNVPPTQWPLGRVLELYPGRDGVVRVALIKLKNSVVKRPVVRLCIMPIDD